MASLPPGWAADYDGQRWFFTYGPTGQSQFQFPRPGDEFPDLLPNCAFGFGAAAAVLPVEEEISPEERLESETLVSRVLDASGGFGERRSESPREVVVSDGGLRGAGRDDGVGAVCFGSFAAVAPRGIRGLGGARGGGTRATGQSGRHDGDGASVPTDLISIAADPRGTSGEPLSVREGEHVQAASSHHQALGPPATMSIMSEPVLAVAEKKAVASSLVQQDENQFVSVAELSPHESPMPYGRAVNSAQSPPWVLSVGDIPELYSESTALCEEEINPPPVELPCDEDGSNGQPVIPNTASENVFELPAYEETGISLRCSNSAGVFEPSCLPGVHAVTSQNGLREVPGEKSRGQDRAGLPSQASRASSETPLDKTPLRERVSPGPDQMASTKDDDQPLNEKIGTERRDLTHFPSILRPGPRQPGQQQRQPPVLPAPVTNTSHGVYIELGQPLEPRYEDKVQGGAVQHEQTARMPTMPPQPDPIKPQQATARTTSPDAPPLQSGGARQDRLPSSVNFVIPIRHMSGGEAHSSSDSTATRVSAEYDVRASFAPARSSEQPLGTGRRDSDCEPGLRTARKTESWGWRADEAGPAQLVDGRPAPGVVPKWSWGWAR